MPSSTLHGNGWVDGDINNDQTVDCYYGDPTCTGSTASNGSSKTLWGNGYVESGSPDMCYYNDATCGTTAGGSTNSDSSGCGDGTGACDDDGVANSYTCYYGEECIASGYTVPSTDSCVGQNCDADGVDNSGTCVWNEQCTTSGQTAQTESCSDGTNSCYDDGVTSGSYCYYGEDCDGSGYTAPQNESMDAYCSGSTLYENATCTSSGANFDSYDCNTNDVTSSETDAGGSDYDDYGQCFGGNDYSCGSGSCTNTSYADQYDYCVNSTHLRESEKTGQFTCGYSGYYDCSDGGSSATDSDGSDEYTPNTCQGGSTGTCGSGYCQTSSEADKIDDCKDSTTLNEGVASGAQCSYTEKSCGDVGCKDNGAGSADRCHTCGTTTATCSAGSFIAISYLDDSACDPPGIGAGTESCTQACNNAGAVCDGDQYNICNGSTSVYYDSATQTGNSTAGQCPDGTDYYEIDCRCEVTSDTSFEQEIKT